MRVVHAFKDYFPPTRGGIEQHINDLVHSMEGFDFAVLTSSRSRRRVLDNDGGVRVIRAPEYARPASTAITPGWRKLIKSSGADLLHFHMPNPFGELMFLGARTWSPMIATYHADIVGRELAMPIFSRFQQKFLSLAKHIVVGNPKIPETSEALADHKDRVVVIPYGVDARLWESRPPLADEIREKYEPPIILFLGRLVYYKGVEVLIEAMRSVDGTALIVGQGPRRAELEAVARHARVSRRVHFLGEVPDQVRAAYYHAADVFVLPSISRAEAFGISMLEAMACGTPVISTEIGTGTSWLNVSKETGLVVAPGDPAALSGAIKTMLRDESWKRAMGEKAKQRIADHFTKREMLDSLASLYRSI